MILSLRFNVRFSYCTIKPKDMLFRTSVASTLFQFNIFLLFNYTCNLEKQLLGLVVTRHVWILFYASCNANLESTEKLLYGIVAAFYRIFISIPLDYAMVLT